MNNSYDDRRIAREMVGTLTVSTVQLGVEHAGGMWFETMVFDHAASGWEDLYCDRYATEPEAKAGHARVVAALLDGKTPAQIAGGVS